MTAAPLSWLPPLFRHARAVVHRRASALQVTPHFHSLVPDGVFPTETQVTEWIELLHDQALLTEGSTLSAPNRFARRMTALLTQVAAQAASRAANGAVSG